MTKEMSEGNQKRVTVSRVGQMWLNDDQKIIDIVLEATDAILSNRDRKGDPQLRATQYLHNSYPGLSNEVVDELAAQAAEMIEEIDEEKSQL